ncbi:hypothetical protein THAOC_36611, partial [Thalassiosira oceanica]
AAAGESNPGLFKKIGGHVAGLMCLDSFKPQELSNTVWAFATAGASHPELFRKIGDHIAGLDSLDSFNSQDVSSTAWAFASAGTSHPELFRKIGDHVAGLDSLDSFKPQAFSNTAWAYATARVFHSRLFEKLVTEAVAKKDHFESQPIANFLWACATVGYTDERSFSAFAPVIASKLDKFIEQDLANIAWTYSVANAPQDLFNEGYVGALASNENEFSGEQLAQLHQWQLWHQELESGIELPRSLRAKCRNAFTSQGYSESKLQNDVVGELKAAGLDLEEEVLLGSGYQIDALVKFGNGRKVAVEVDGPFHFIDRRPAGRTTLKQRQVARLDRIEVVSVPYWEWNELKNSVTKQRYLRKKLGCTNNTRVAPPPPRRRLYHNRYLRPEPLEPVLGPLGRVRDGVPGQQAREQAQEKGLEVPTGVPPDEKGRQEHARQDEAPHRQAREHVDAWGPTASWSRGGGTTIGTDATTKTTKIFRRDRLDRPLVGDGVGSRETWAAKRPRLRARSGAGGKAHRESIETLLIMRSDCPPFESALLPAVAITLISRIVSHLGSKIRISKTPPQTHKLERPKDDGPPAASVRRPLFGEGRRVPPEPPRPHRWPRPHRAVHPPRPDRARPLGLRDPPGGLVEPRPVQALVPLDGGRPGRPPYDLGVARPSLLIEARLHRHLRGGAAGHGRGPRRRAEAEAGVPGVDAPQPAREPVPPPGVLAPEAVAGEPDGCPGALRPRHVHGRAVVRRLDRPRFAERRAGPVVGREPGRLQPRQERGPRGAPTAPRGGRSATCPSPRTSPTCDSCWARAGCGARRAACRTRCGPS